jgi:hypothetical protein
LEKGGSIAPVHPFQNAGRYAKNRQMERANRLLPLSQQQNVTEQALIQCVIDHCVNACKGL